MLFEHYSQIPKGLWRWANFTPREIACRGTGEILINFDALDRLQLLRELIGEPLTINSAYRSRLHNARIGGAPLSRHKFGDAFDIKLTGNKYRHKKRIHELAKKVGFKGFGLNYNSFIHIDMGARRTW